MEIQKGMKKLALTTLLLFSGITYVGAQTNADTQSNVDTSKTSIDTTIQDSDEPRVDVTTSGKDTLVIQKFNTAYLIYTNLNATPDDITTVDIITIIRYDGTICHLNRFEIKSTKEAKAEMRSIFNDADLDYNNKIKTYFIGHKN
jgi:hypothetical protein